MPNLSETEQKLNDVKERKVNTRGEILIYTTQRDVDASHIHTGELLASVEVDVRRKVILFEGSWLVVSKHLYHITKDANQLFMFKHPCQTRYHPQEW